MPIQKLHFFAPLANADDSILKIKLNEGFEFDSMTQDEGISFIVDLEKVPLKYFYNFWQYSHIVFHSEKMIFIKNSFEFDLPLKEAGKPDTDHNFTSFIYNFVEKNVEAPLRLLRLFSEGNVHIPYWIIYYYEKGTPFVLFARGLNSSQSKKIYHLNNKKIQDAQEFIKITQISTPHNYITLAQENYEVSYFTENDSLAFLSLMISLEVLIKPQRENRFSKEIARNAGMMLGMFSPYHIVEIEYDISDLYSKRSQLIHNGKMIWCAVGEPDDVLLLRCYVRKLLKRIIHLNISKDRLLERLNNRYGWSDI